MTSIRWPGAMPVVAVLLAAPLASAATFNVNSYVDSVDAAPGNGTCADSAGRCTLRAAILEANALAGADTILAPPGVYNMTLGGANEDNGLTGDLDIRSDITIIGLGTTRIESQVGRVVHVISGNVSITGLTLVFGDANQDIGSGRAGGAVHNTAGSTLTLNNCTVRDSTGQGGGGAIFNGGTLTLNASTLTLNSALGTSPGGAVLNAGAMTITNSTLSGNSATAGGGAIFSAPGSTLAMNNVTISDNTTSGGSDGGGIRIDPAATATLSNNILANNQASGTSEDCLGAITSLGDNLVEIASGCTGLGANDITGIDPLLGPLQDNGGRTFTHALLAGSPAINAGGFTACELTDQRGLARPQGPACDIGAFELFPNCPAVTVSPATLPDGDPGIFYTQTITATGGIAPHTFSVTSGTLPPGMALNGTTGILSGVPTTVGVFNFTVTAFDANFCRGSRTYTIVIGNPCNNVTITLSPTTMPDGALGTPYSQQVTATGGAAPYQYTVTAGTLPPGLALNLTTGVVSGTPIASGTYFFLVTATDANLCTGSQAYVITIECALDVQPASLPPGTEGVAYNQTLTAAGAAPVTFAVVSGSLPPGLSLTGAGVLSGTPTAPGTYTFVVEATDANNCTGARGYTLVIRPCLVVSPDSLPNGTLGTTYSQQLTTTGGTPPISFTVSSGTLPAGVTLSAGGLISGTPTAGGISLFTVDASASGGCVVSKDYSIVVNAAGCPAIAVTPTVLPTGQVGQNYNQSFAASGGSAPYTFTFLTGDLPAGLTLAAGGSLSGTPVESGVFTFTVAATDSNGCTGTATITLSVTPVNCPAVTLFPPELPNGQIGVAYNQGVIATGGEAPYAYTVSGGTLPPGLTLNAATGALSGTPTASGSFTFTVRATDTELCFGARSYAVTITAGVFAAALVIQADTNGVWEPGETVTLVPFWTNGSQIAIPTVTGTLGTTNTTITLTDTSASYGTIAAGATVSCSASGNCYGATAVGPRPGTHWDAPATELLSTSNSKVWRLHVAASFADVPATNPFYRFIETLLHHSVTSGCSPTDYCPLQSTTREQMSVFVLVAKERIGYLPPPCSPPNVFSDVPETSPFCRWIEELARRGVAGGCGGGNYCPLDPITRAQMAVFVLRTFDPALNPPACGTPMFLDLAATSPFCRWVEELARRGVVAGCGGGNYCPGDPVTRQQMGVFIGVTFGLTLYGP